MEFSECPYKISKKQGLDLFIGGYELMRRRSIKGQQ